MSKSTFFANKAIDNFTGVAAYSPATRYVGLSTTAPNDDGTGVTEPSGNGYARVLADGKFAAAAAKSASNNAKISFPQSTGAWASGAPLAYAVFYDAITGGNMLRRTSAIATPRTVDAAGITLVFEIGDLTITEA